MSDLPSVEHYPTECLYDGIRRERFIMCECGHHANGDTWEECGAEMDAHLTEHGDK